MNLPKRKPTRLKEYDYSTAGAYFVTICTQNRRTILGEIVGDGVYDIPQINLSDYGKIAEKHIQQIGKQYDNICIDKYVVMPNHIHLIIHITQAQQGNILHGTSQVPSPTNAIIPKFVSLYKRYCRQECKQIIFQRSYHDHIIRDEADYQNIWNYIDNNPAKWQEDCFYITD